MVNSKKMSKSSVAVIVLAILLVLSMVLGLTGAWFTDKVEQSGSQSPEFGFGLVDIEADGEGQAGVTYAIASNDVSKMVDHDKITVADTLAIKNNSTVEILYVVEKSFTVTVSGEGANYTAEDLKGWLKTEQGDSLESGDYNAMGRVAAKGDIALQGRNATYELKSEGAANGKVGTFKITVSANVYAVQAGNVDTVEELQAAFQAAGYAGYSSLTLEMFA